MKKRKDKLIIFLFHALLFTAIPSVQAQTRGYDKEILDWREKYKTNLLKDTGWLTLTGLFWLKEGVNTVGKAGISDVELTESFSGERFGEIELKDGVAFLRTGSGVKALIDGTSVSEGEIFRDGNNGATKTVHIGSQSFFVIKREERYGVRLRDTKSPARSKFTGLNWYSVDTRYRIKASFEAFPNPDVITVPNILGGTFEYKSPGLLKFELDGNTNTLQPVIEEGSNKLFIIFRDDTARTETYGGGRFLYAELPKEGNTVILDFNKAYNPPCAYTPFATCPLPPQQNRLAVRIPAGEKRYSDH